MNRGRLFGAHLGELDASGSPFYVQIMYKFLEKASNVIKRNIQKQAIYRHLLAHEYYIK